MYEALTNQACALFTARNNWKSIQDAAVEIAHSLGHKRGSVGFQMIFEAIQKKLPKNSEHCPKCHGTGIHSWVNKYGRQSGECFQCNGKGFTTPTDRNRSEYYWSQRKAGTNETSR